MSVRTRFAPSPTGYLHVGGVRTALFNYLWAKRHGGQFILRIDDTDEQRHVAEALQPILDGFRWMGMLWDEGPEVGGPHGPYFQSERGALYATAAEALIRSGHLYPCLALEAELQAKKDLARAAKQPFVYRGPTRDMDPNEALELWQEKRPALRFKVPAGRAIKLKDHVRGDVEWQSDLLGDFTAVRAGGKPLYNFASVVDDIDLRITHVIRAEEHLANTQPQLLIWEALGAPLPEFAHIPFVAKPGSKVKLSKRNPPPGVMVALAEYEQAGYLPDALFNAFARLGWSLDGETEVMSRATIVANFSLDRITSASAALDMHKIYWFQDQYMRRMPEDEKVRAMMAVLRAEGLAPAPTPADEAKLRRIIHACGDRLKLMRDIVPYADYLFRAGLQFEPKAAKALQAAGAKEQVDALRAKLAAVEPFAAAGIEAAVHELAAALGVGGKINHALRAAATGRTVGAGVFESLEILGKEGVLANFAASLAAISSGEFPPLAA